MDLKCPECGSEDVKTPHTVRSGVSADYKLPHPFEQRKLMCRKCLHTWDNEPKE